MKKILKLVSGLLSLVLICVTIFSICSSNTDTDINTPVRNVELNSQQINSESCYKAFDSYDITIQYNKSTFEGLATLKLSDYVEIDNVNLNDIGENATLKFTSTFDYDNGVSTLNVYIVDCEDISIIDTIYGVALINENGEVDVVYNFDGELILLSELRDSGRLDNVSWFTNLVKSAVKGVVKTVSNAVSATVKVLSTPNGAIGTVITLAACAAIGGVCAFIPGGQIVTGICASFAGSIIGSIGFKLTAQAAQQQNPTITQDEIDAYSIVGGFVGSAVSVASCAKVSTIRANIKYKEFNSYNEYLKEMGKANNSAVKYGNAGENGTYEWHHIVEQSQIGKNGIQATQVYNTNNTISLGYDTHRQISGIYASKIQNLGKQNISGLTNLFPANQATTVRNYMSTLSYDQQYKLGIQILKLLGVTI